MSGAPPDVALVFSPEAWVENLHRHLTDHGGARIRQVVMDPGLALEDDYGVLVVSQRWPALTHAFVRSLHGAGRRILGVFDATEPAGRDHLTALGVDASLPADAPVDVFVRTFLELAPEPDVAGRGADAALDEPAAVARAQVTVVGGPGGAGATEVAVALATMSVDAGCSTVLLDADEVAPAVGVRLGLELQPNLRSAIEAVEYGLGELDAALQRMPHSCLEVLAGAPNPAAWSDVRAGEVLDVLEVLTRRHDHVVADTSSRLEDLVVDGQGRHAVSRAVLRRGDRIVGVTTSTPAGLTALVQWVADVRSLNRDAPLHVVLNRAPADAFRRRELEDELVRSVPDAAVAFVPTDQRVEGAAWEGVAVPRGPFVRSMSAVAAALVPPGAPARPSGRRLLSRRVLARSR